MLTRSATRKGGISRHPKNPPFMTRSKTSLKRHSEDSPVDSINAKDNIYAKKAKGIVSKMSCAVVQEELELRLGKEKLEAELKKSKDKSVMGTLLSAAIEEDYRKDENDPINVDEEVFFCNQLNSTLGGSLEQIFNEKRGKGLVLGKSSKLVDMITDEIVETLREMVKRNAAKTNQRMFANHHGNETIYSETRKSLVMTMDVEATTTLPSREVAFRFQADDQGVDALTEDRKKEALRVVFAALDFIKSMPFYELIKKNNLVEDKYLVLSIISNFGTAKKRDDRQGRHRDFSDEGDCIINYYYYY